MGGGASKRAAKQPAKGGGLTVDMLLLGAPNVGKSTVFRQMKLLYRGGFTEAERFRAKIELRRNLISSLLKLDDVALDLGFNLESNAAEEAVTQLKLVLQDYQYDERDDANCIEARAEDQQHKQQQHEQQQQNRTARAIGAAVKPESGAEPVEFPTQHVQTVFNDPSIQQAYKVVTSADFELPKSDAAGRELLQTALPYVMADMARIVASDYEPSDADCLHLRRHTTSIERIEFECPLEINRTTEQVKCSCTDIGGQAQEQTKWERQASGTDLIVFVAAVSDFDVQLPGGENALQQQFALLAQVLRAKCFEGFNVIVILNKSDLLADKLASRRLVDFFPDFAGENTTADAQRFFEEKSNLILDEVTRELRQKQRRNIQLVPTCALDSDMMRKVLIKALAASVYSSLMDCGLI